jgi:hypothetical protein
MGEDMSGSRIRRRLTVDRVAGGFGYTEEVLPAAEFTQRVTELKASLPDIGPAAARTAVLACDGCGAREELDFDDPRYPAGWRELPTGDFCPDCVAALQ